MTFFDAFVVAVGITLLGLYAMNRRKEVSYVKSSVDGEEYLVRNASDKQEAANVLARLNIKALELIDKLKDARPDMEMTKRLVKRYDPRALSEGGYESGYTSYSVNKGQSIVICLRDKADDKDTVPGKLEDENVLTYVLLHELAHIATKDVGHTDKFWAIFKEIVKTAVDIGIYQDRDFSKNPAQYCGINIDSSSVTKPTGKKE